MNIVVCQNKKQEMIDLFATVDRRNKYKLYIASCYFNSRSATYFIGGIADKIRITGVNIYIDKKEAIKIGKPRLIRWIASARNRFEIEVNLYPVNESSIFHAKAYALVADSPGNPPGGMLIVGSANLTGAGLTSAHGNVEAMLATTEALEIDSFRNSLMMLQTTHISEIDRFANIDNFDLQVCSVTKRLFYLQMEWYP
ncbi:phospholipase D-like domain-containing protein [uncultured Thiodictyon sp.]|uniref:phospholipase D-like domain-containing protein n=1 Tax=uncultured Thiodictyon sp. TaxID=1846217 RepID=UPI0025E8F52E|nr:phospholipase D-like domain-containing protein [uncultured Thiodictyon sp.]